MRSANNVDFAIVSTLLRISAMPNSPMTTAKSSMPPLRLTGTECVTFVSIDDVKPTAAVRNPSAIISTPLMVEPEIMNNVQTNAEHHQRRNSQEAKANGDRCNSWRKERHNDDTKCASDERTNRRDAERQASPAPARAIW